MTIIKGHLNKQLILFQLNHITTVYIFINNLNINLPNHKKHKSCIAESWEFIEFMVILNKSMLLWKRKISIILIIFIHVVALNITNILILYMSSIYGFQIIKHCVQKTLLIVNKILLRNSNSFWNTN